MLSWTSSFSKRLPNRGCCEKDVVIKLAVPIPHLQTGERLYIELDQQEQTRRRLTYWLVAGPNGGCLACSGGRISLGDT